MTFRRAFALAVGFVLAGAATNPSRACEACFSANVDSPLVDGAKVGVWLLLGVTAVVQGGFVAFFLHLRRHASRAKSTEIEADWSDLQRSISRS